LKIASTFVVMIAAAVAVPAAATTKGPVDDLLDRATAYVRAYVHEFSTVVAEERYVQDSHPMPRVDAMSSIAGAAQPAQHAELRSDLLFVRPGESGSWLTFRDVYSVNGRPVRDREERLAKLFVQPSTGAVDRAEEIAREGYRYNVGLKERTVANPMLAVAFLQPDYRRRFEFRLSGIDTSLGPDVWIVKFKERERPTILRTPDNRNVPGMGRFWIDGASGRVLQTELETSTGDKVMTVFAFDERLQLDVPVEMRDIGWLNGTVITGTATYTNFRRFGVATNEKFR
jgi:hypothetical protein